MNISQEHYEAMIARMVKLELHITNHEKAIEYINQQLDYHIKNKQLVDDRLDEMEKIIDEELS